MALVRYTGITPVAGSTVSVFRSGTQVLVDLYEDQAGAMPLANPFTADTDTGAYTFVAEQEALDVVIGQADEAPEARVPLPPSVIFNGDSPARRVALIIEDPDTREIVTLAEVMY